jgi:hypothetical protein
VVCGVLLISHRVKKELCKDENFLAAVGKQAACSGISVTSVRLGRAEQKKPCIPVGASGAVSAFAACCGSEKPASQAGIGLQSRFPERESR